jgi:hypothetical protein
MRPAPVVRVCALYKLFRRLAISNAARLRFQHDDIDFQTVTPTQWLQGSLSLQSRNLDETTCDGFQSN